MGHGDVPVEAEELIRLVYFWLRASDLASTGLQTGLVPRGMNPFSVGPGSSSAQLEKPQYLSQPMCV